MCIGLFYVSRMRSKGMRLKAVRVWVSADRQYGLHRQTANLPVTAYGELEHSVTRHGGEAASWVSDQKADLDTPYRGSGDFESQPRILGLHAALITNVPAELALYLPPDSDTLTPTAGERVNTLGFLVPKELNHEGLGACAFVLADSNAFQSAAALVVGNFVRAALNPNGACQLDFPGIDLSAALPSSCSAPPYTALMLPVTIHNVGQESTSWGIVQIALPVGVRVVDADMSPNCSLQFEATGNQPQVLQCSLSTLAPQASQTIALLIIGAAVGTFALQVEVQAIEVDIDLSNNRASSQLIVGAVAPVSPHPIPLNTLWFLLGLSGLMAIGAMRRGKQ